MCCQEPAISSLFPGEAADRPHPPYLEHEQREQGQGRIGEEDRGDDQRERHEVSQRPPSAPLFLLLVPVRHLDGQHYRFPFLHTHQIHTHTPAVSRTATAMAVSATSLRPARR